MKSLEVSQAPSARPLAWLEKLTISLNWEIVLFAAIVVLAFVTRFMDLGVRVMSHDETQHTYFSWLFFKGSGYQHTPLTHGPLQFHLMALSYSLFGDNDLAARIPHAIASLLSVLFLWNFRRYLGKIGTLLAALFLVISPFMLYYGRYARNESLVVLFGLITIWAILRYLENGQTRYLFYLTAATALHFTAKETAFIYTAQAILFLTLLLIRRVTGRRWRNQVYYRPFLLAVIAGFILLGIAFTVAVVNAAIQDGETSPIPSFLILFPEILAILSFGLAIFFVIRGLGMTAIRQERAFNLAMLLGLLVLPQLAPIPANYLGFDPLDYSQAGMLRTGLVLLPIVVLNIGLGLWWNWRLFAANLAIFYGIFTVFYTTLFTYAQGFFTGLIGSLGYWLEQQGVQRGSQPWYYYLLVQLPVYEFLPVLGSLLAAGMVLYRRLTGQPINPDQEQSVHPADMARLDELDQASDERLREYDSAADEADRHSLHPWTYPQSAPTLALLGFWAVTALAAYSIAGEKMPWLTVHITLPMILLSGWSVGQLIERIQWREILRPTNLAALILLPIFTRSLRSVFDLAANLAAGTPLSPPDVPGLLVYGLFALASGAGLFYLLRGWSPVQFGRVILLAGFAGLAFLTLRAGWQAAFIRYDEATEFLVYAHSAPANKMLTRQFEELSERANGDLSLGIAYDNSDGEGDPASAWPLTWYFRNFTNTRSYGPEVPRELLDYPIVIASDRNWDKVEPVLRDAYDQFQYIRMWWPVQDYFDLTWERIWNALTDSAMRNALVDIWLNRDFRAYAQATGQDLNLPNWQPSRAMRVYIRKDMSALVWNQGSTPVVIDLPADPYAGGEIELEAVNVIGEEGTAPGQFQGPRGLAVAADDSVYVADTFNHRIQHLDPNGEVLNTWGSFSGAEASLAGNAEPGTFNEPWDVAVGPDGSVYVADTWNSRVQKFTPDGELLSAWGYFGQAETPQAMWGPRGIAVDSNGRVFVSDTGNKRVVVFDSQGESLSVINLDLDEPVGLAFGPDGRLYIADTWNQRIIAVQEPSPNIFTLENSWLIDGWFGQSLENKPYLTIDSQGRLYVTDPEAYRVLEFTTTGQFVQYWGGFGTSFGQFRLPTGVSVGPDGSLWVADSGAHRIMQFQVPQD